MRAVAVSDSDSEDGFCIGNALEQAETAPPLEVNEFRSMDSALEAKLACLLERTLRFLARITSHTPSTSALAVAGAPYWACGGTLLGAARHGGFIPWDDDVDFSLLLPEGAATVRAADLRAAARECGLCVCDADSVGLRLFLLPISHAAPSAASQDRAAVEGHVEMGSTRHHNAVAEGALPFPFCDIFLLQRGAALKRAALKEWCSQYATRVASRESGAAALGMNIRAAPTEGEARADWCVLADATGRELWPAEAYPLADICCPALPPTAEPCANAPAATLPFYSSSVGELRIPVPRNVDAYLDVTYGADWRTTARTHNLVHGSGAAVMSQCAPLVEALFLCATRVNITV